MNIVKNLKFSFESFGFSLEVTSDHRGNFLKQYCKKD